MRKPRLAVDVSKYLVVTTPSGLSSELSLLPSIRKCQRSQVRGSGCIDENYNETDIGQEMHVMDKKNKEKWRHKMILLTTGAENPPWATLATVCFRCFLGM